MNKPTQNKWYAFVPNLLTMLNLICGVVAIYFAFTAEIKTALFLMLFGGLFDFFDGFAARLLKVSGELGKQLDSLADLITFGLLPGVMIFALQRELILEANSGFEHLSVLQWIYLVSPILIPVFSALRLAKFNIDTRQTNSFIGVPTPANAFFLASLAYTFFYSGGIISEWLANSWIILAITITFSLLLVSNLSMFALKFKSFGWKGNELRYVFLIMSLTLLITLNIQGFMAIILLYLLLSIVNSVLSQKKND